MLHAGNAAWGCELPRMSVTIYHNSACGTSRNTLALIRATGVEPKIVHYLETPPSLQELTLLIQAMGITPRDLLREKGTPSAELGLGDASLTDCEIIEAMAEHPILINRPIVEGPKGTKLCRPSEEVLSLLDGELPEDFIKEDGGVVPASG